MIPTLDYSTEPLPVIRPVRGSVAAIVSLLWAGWLNWYLIGFAQEYLIWQQSPCGTAAASMHDKFFILSPVFILFPVGAWGVSHHAHFAQVWARCGVWASLAGWAVTAALIQYGY